MKTRKQEIRELYKKIMKQHPLYTRVQVAKTIGITKQYLYAVLKDKSKNKV